MSTRLLIAALLTASALPGCARKDPPARPGKMRARPGATSTAAPAPTTAPAKGGTTGPVVTAGMLQVYKRFVTIEDILRSGRGTFGRLKGDLPIEAFRKEAQPAVDAEIARVLQGTIALGDAERALTDSQKASVRANVDHAKAEMITRAGGSLEQLRHDLAADGVELDDLLEDHRRDLTIRMYHHNTFMPSIVITRKMMWEYYTAHRDTYITERAVRLGVIALPAAALLKPGLDKPTDAQISAARAEARKRVRAAAVAVAGGESFESVATALGKTIREGYGKAWEEIYFRGKTGIDRMADAGGLWSDMMKPESFKDDVLARAAKDLAQGQVGAVEETDTCCYLIKAAQVQKAGHVSFEDAQEEIERLLRNKEFTRRRGAHLARTLSEFDRLMRPRDEQRLKRFKQIVLDRVVATYHGK